MPGGGVFFFFFFKKLFFDSPKADVSQLRKQNRNNEVSFISLLNNFLSLIPSTELFQVQNCSILVKLLATCFSCKNKQTIMQAHYFCENALILYVLLTEGWGKSELFRCYLLKETELSQSLY